MRTNSQHNTNKSQTPFGSPLIGRSWEADSVGGYRFGMCGQEKDDEIYEEGNGLNFGARIYNSRLGKWFSIDPLFAKYPSLSSYNYCANNPIYFIDENGEVIVVPNVADRKPILKMINSRALGTFKFNDKGELCLVTGKGAPGFSTYYRDKLISAINENSNIISISISPTYTGIGGTVKNTDDAGGGVTLKFVNTFITETTNPVDGTKSTSNSISEDAKVIISGNPNMTVLDEKGEPLRDDPADILMHELVGHAVPYITHISDTGNAVENENKARVELKTGMNQKRAPESTLTHPE